jgi:hypothetical protein
VGVGDAVAAEAHPVSANKKTMADTNPVVKRIFFIIYPPEFKLDWPTDCCKDFTMEVLAHLHKSCFFIDSIFGGKISSYSPGGTHGRK